MQQEIVDYLNEIALEKGIKIDNDMDLFDAGILDSMEMIVFLNFLNEQLNINFDFSDLDFENFKSINRIMKWIANK